MRRKLISKCGQSHLERAQVRLLVWQECHFPDAGALKLRML